MASDVNGSDRKASILSAAEEVFGDCGYAATTMEAVADKTGISKGSIYNYFHNKQDLFKSVFDRSFHEMEAQNLQILDSATTATRKIEALVDFWFQRLARHTYMGRLILEFWATAARQGEAGELAKMLREMIGLWRGRLGAVLTQGIEAGEFGDSSPSVSASLIMSILNGIEVQAILELGLNVDQELVEALKRAILAALRAGRDKDSHLPLATSD